MLIFAYLITFAINQELDILILCQRTHIYLHLDIRCVITIFHTQYILVFVHQTWVVGSEDKSSTSALRLLVKLKLIMQSEHRKIRSIKHRRPLLSTYPFGSAPSLQATLSISLGVMRILHKRADRMVIVLSHHQSRLEGRRSSHLLILLVPSIERPCVSSCWH